MALVTGATDGVGKATSARLLRDGWRVIISGRSRERCAAAATELRAAVPGAQVSAIVADLSDMGEVQRAVMELRATLNRLDVLVLNANAITQAYTKTRDGFEANLAVGYLGRALLAWGLEDVLRRTPESQVLTVVGVNLQRIDFDDPSTPVGFSSMKALGRWQWAMQVFAREWNRRVPSVAMNVYMPGLVKTKILANEPQPMRALVQVAKFVIGIPVARSGDELVAVLDDVRAHHRRDAYYARTKLKRPRDLGEQSGDGPRLWELTDRMLAPWRVGRAANQTSAP